MTSRKLVFQYKDLILSVSVYTILCLCLLGLLPVITSNVKAQEETSEQHQQSSDLYIDGESHIYKVSKKNGKILWTSQSLGQRSGSGEKLLVGENEIITYNDANVIFALDRDNGDTLWQRKISAGYISKIFTIKDNLLYLVTSQEVDNGFQRTLMALNITTGHQRWNYSFTNDFSGHLLMAGDNSFHIVGDTILFGNADGHIIALKRQDGTTLWKHPINIPADMNITSMTLQIARNDIFAGISFFNNTSTESTGTLLRLTLKNGQQHWQRQIPGSIEFMQYHPQAGIVFASSPFFFGEQQLYCIHPQTGEERWIAENTFHIQDMLLTSNAIYIENTMSAILNTLDVKTGKITWQLNPDPSENQKGTLSSIAVTDQRVFVHATTTFSGINALFALNPEGKVLWNYSFGEQGYGLWLNPLVNGNQIYGGNTDRITQQSHLYSLDQKRGTVTWQLIIPEPINTISLAQDTGNLHSTYSSAFQEMYGP